MLGVLFYIIVQLQQLKFSPTPEISYLFLLFHYVIYAPLAHTRTFPFNIRIIQELLFFYTFFHIIQLFLKYNASFLIFFSRLLLHEFFIMFVFMLCTFHIFWIFEGIQLDIFHSLVIYCSFPFSLVCFNYLLSFINHIDTKAYFSTHNFLFVYFCA